MGLRSFFHKIKIGFVRKREPSLPYTTQVKKYGDWGEDEFISAIHYRLPDCKIKRNMISKLHFFKSVLVFSYIPFATMRPAVARPVGIIV